jgi:P27 family predicted phage terminase small subunit
MAAPIHKRPARNPGLTPMKPQIQAVSTPEPPAHLSDEAQAIWRDVCSEWELDAAGMPILRGGLESWDQYQRARAEVVRDGPTFTAENGMIRAHPASKIALDNFNAFRQALRQLGLEPVDG